MIGIVSLMFCWILATTEIFCYRPLPFPNVDFRCNDGIYIHSSLFCDGAANCRDGSDESFGCDWDHCSYAEFKCGSDGPCIAISGRCNTIPECPDGSDELYCGEETHIGNCTLQNGKYLCQDGLRCLDFNNACDGDCNCFDCSDETDLCDKFDSRSCMPCPLYCLPTPKGPQCIICNSSNYETSKLCNEIENCTGNVLCSQYCTRYKGVPRCLCYEDHHEIQDDGTKCRKNVWLEQVLLYSTATKIKMLNITKQNRTEIIPNAVNCTALTAAKDHLYYASYNDNKGRIFKSKMGDRNPEKVIELDSTINSLAVDWISNNLYFASNKSLFVCSNDGRFCTLLKCCIVDYVVLAPKFGWMFFTHNVIGDSEQLVMKSNMDGSEEKALVDMSFDYPTPLAVDEWNEIVYCLSEMMMYTFSLDGSIIHKRHLPTTQGFSISNHFSVMERYLFILHSENDYDNNVFYNITARDMDRFSTYTDMETNKIRNLFTYNPFIQFISGIENPCAKSSCNGLCLIHSTPYRDGLNYTCMCDNFIPTDDNSWCTDRPARSVLRSQSTTETEVQTSSIKQSSTSTMKNDAFTSTKATTVLPLPNESLSCGHCPATGNFNITSCLSFAFVMLVLYLLIRKNQTIKRSRTVNLSEQIEL